MIELGHIHLRHRSSIYEARKKVRGLAQALGYDPIAATRLTTAVSAATREMLQNCCEPRIGVALAMEASPPQLVLDFEGRGTTPNLIGLSEFFDGSPQKSADGEFLRLRVFKHLPNAAFKATDQFVAEQRARIQNLSREELLVEIQRKNRELEQHSAALEETVAQRTEQLKEAMKAAEDASRAKSGFLANMSHELRTPMNAIIGYSEMLMEDAEEQENEEALSDLKKIHSAGNHLLSLINDVLDISKIEAGQMDLYLETFNVSEVIHEVVNTIDTLVRTNDNVLSLELDPSLGEMHADVTKVRQSLFNLLSNAAKFTHQGEIRLAVKAAQMDGEAWVQMDVSDSGIGIPPEKLEHVFKEFSQADDSTTRDYGGTGLGLPISRRFCQMMGGDITMKSTVGQGSTFTILLPQVVEQPDGAAEVEAAPVATASETGEERVVLVVDDDLNSRELLERNLQGAGVRVVTASNGEEALQLARTLQPAAITLDVLMPGMDGWEVLRKLKAAPETRDIPVVMITMTDDRELGLALGATDFLTKPVQRQQLIQLLERHAPEGGARYALVVDDKAENREILGHALEKEGWRVAEAENGRVALERIAEHPPSLILLDLLMPVMDGFEFVLEMRKRDASRAIPIVVVTAKDVTEEDRLRLNGDVVGLIQKDGLERESLLALLREQVTEASRKRS